MPQKMNNNDINNKVSYASSAFATCENCSNYFKYAILPQKNSRS